jgi:HK97 gp10 family phage protein
VIEVRISLRGGKELARKFKVTPYLLRKLNAEVAAKGAKATVVRAQRFVPKLTHRLERAIYAERVTDLTYIVGVRPGDGSRTDPAMYARYVEYGTAKKEARPFMRPAIEAERAYLPARMRQVKALLEAQVRAA